MEEKERIDQIPTCQTEDSHCVDPLVEVKGWQRHNRHC